MANIQPKNITVDSFNSAYYAGSDVYVYFNDTYMDETLNIQYSVSEQVLPIFAYGDYTYRFAAHGMRFIQGTFSLNFKRSLYITQVLANLTTSLVGVGTASTDSSSFSTNNLNSVANPQTIEEVLGMSSGGKTINKNILNSIATKNQAQFWAASNPIAAPQTNTPLFSTRPDGFTIFIKFGDPTSLKQGSIDSISGSNTTQPGTIKSLINVHITGSSQQVDDSGRPIYETYSFIASDLISD